jgi:hypothetical protein
MGAVRNTVFVGKAEEKRPLQTSRHRWKYNIKINFNKIGWNSMYWIHLPHDMDEWWGLMNILINLRVPYNAGNFLSSSPNIRFPRTTLPHQVG